MAVVENQQQVVLIQQQQTERQQERRDTDTAIPTTSDVKQTGDATCGAADGDVEANGNATVDVSNNAGGVVQCETRDKSNHDVDNVGTAQNDSGG